MRTSRALAGLVLASAVCLAAGGPPGAEELRSWKDTPTRAALLAFVEQVTKEGSPDFVEPAERIAVFDNDGTLWSEQPIYVQLAFVADRVRALAPEHPEWKREEPFASLLAGDLEGVAASGHQGLLELLAATHSGMTATEFEATVRSWLQTARHPETGRSYLERVYQPQLELLAFLREKGFRTFIVSGGGVDFMRPWTQDVYGIPSDQVVGSSLRAKYEVRNGTPVIVKLPEVEFIDDKAGKPVGIHRFIGRRPLLAFGNSDGDFEMLEYTTAGPGPRLGLLLHHDDAEREAAYDRDSHVGRLARGLDEAEQRGWLVVSMKADWSRVFPPRDGQGEDGRRAP